MITNFPQKNLHCPVENMPSCMRRFSTVDLPCKKSTESNRPINQSWGNYYNNRHCPRPRRNLGLNSRTDDCGELVIVDACDSGAVFHTFTSHTATAIASTTANANFTSEACTALATATTTAQTNATTDAGQSRLAGVENVRR